MVEPGSSAARQMAAQLGRGLSVIAVGVLLLLGTFGMAIAGLYLVLAHSLVTWVAALVTAAVCALLGVLCLWLGIRRARRRSAPKGVEVAADVVRRHRLGTAVAALGVGLLLGYTERGGDPADGASR